MAKTLAQIQKEINRLQVQADALHQREVADVVARIQSAIQHYGLSADDLFGPGATPAKKPGRQAATPKKPSAKAGRKPAAKNAKAAAKPATKSVAKYHDGQGKTWTGRGKRPSWFKDAVASGKTADELLIPR